MQEESWKDIEGYEGLYMVSNFGRVKSLSRINNYGRHVPERILKNNYNVKSGYAFVNLHKNSDGGTTYTIHRLVATAFIPNPNNLPQVGHKDETRTNNNVNNLYWTTNLENSNTPLRKVRSSIANSRPHTQESKDAIRKVMERKKGRKFIYNNIRFESARALARYLKMNPSTLSRYINRERTMPKNLAGNLIEIKKEAAE